MLFDLIFLAAAFGGGWWCRGKLPWRKKSKEIQQVDNLLLNWVKEDSNTTSYLWYLLYVFYPTTLDRSR